MATKRGIVDATESRNRRLWRLMWWTDLLCVGVALAVLFSARWLWLGVLLAALCIVIDLLACYVYKERGASIADDFWSKRWFEMEQRNRAAREPEVREPSKEL